ncbi:MAG: ABC transporter ATP-binding protein [Chloroflexota bacterium]|nr:ABC transporter ATP-binding protein [Chloroflexota bacterium]MDE3192458.1 ABC transporter ATP-binding protein [Chloroflexota bacterium]
MLAIGAVVVPLLAAATGGGYLVGQIADAGVFVLLAIGLNVVVGFAGLLDLGYAAFFAIGAYMYAELASPYLEAMGIHGGIHLPFWILLFVGMFVAAGFGALLGAPTLRLRGDYLAIVTLGFGEIVPRVVRNLGTLTNGVNGISAVDPPEVPAWISGPWSGDPFKIVTDLKVTDAVGYYLIMVVLVTVCVVLVNNLYRSRIGRAWMAVREDEVAAAAMGVNTVRIKLLAFAIGASLSGFGGAFYASKLAYVSPGNFSFLVSVTILVMVVLGGMGNIPGVIVGSLVIYYILYNFLPDLPGHLTDMANAFGFSGLLQQSGDWPGLAEEASRLKFLVFGSILVATMLLRPQGLMPSRVREQELQKGTHEDTTIEDVGAATGAE